MTHHLTLHMPWEDANAPVLWPKHVRVSPDQYKKGDDILLVIGAKAHPAVVADTRGEGDTYEIILERA